MAIDRVTITGADDSIDPVRLVELSVEYPFAEWGILASYNNTFHLGGMPRYPSTDWLAQLQAYAEAGKLPKLALHINGRWVRELLAGNFVMPASLLTGFDRVQLNFHAERVLRDSPKFEDALKLDLSGKQLIFQLDGELGNQHLDAANAAEVRNCHGLFDQSGGHGITPEQWPRPIYLGVQPGEHGEGVEQWDYHGYAGGLGPHNLAEEIPKILAAAAGTEHTAEGRIWIDMETHVRSNKEADFDLLKVRECLEIAKNFVS